MKCEFADELFWQTHSGILNEFIEVAIQTCFGHNKAKRFGVVDIQNIDDVLRF